MANTALDLNDELDYMMDHLFKGKGAIEMRVSVSDAKGQLTELVRRAEAGDEVILTRRGHEIVRLVAIAAAPGRKGRRALMEKARSAAAAKVLSGPTAARSQDDLYGDDGMPA